MGIEEKFISRRTVLEAGLSLASIGVLGRNVFAEEDYYREAYTAFKSGNLERTASILTKGTRASNNKQQAECYHFLGYLSAQNNDRNTAKQLYAKAFEIADIKSGYVDQVYEQALRADFISEGARVVDEKVGTHSLKIQPRNGDIAVYSKNDWINYYFEDEKIKSNLQALFRESNLVTQKGIHNFMVKLKENIIDVSIDNDGFFSAFIQDSFNPTGMLRLYWICDPKLRKQIEVI